MATDAQFEALRERMRGMSAADLSILEASSKTPESHMTTAPGSANEVLWSEMVKLGWMITRDETLDLPGGRRFPMRIYTITPEGLEPISHLLALISQRPPSSS